jgi:hypothetical protein
MQASILYNAYTFIKHCFWSHKKPYCHSFTTSNSMHNINYTSSESCIHITLKTSPR